MPTTEETIYEQVANRVCPLPLFGFEEIHVVLRCIPHGSPVYMNKGDYADMIRRVNPQSRFQDQRGVGLAFGDHRVNWHECVKPGRVMWTGTVDGVDGVKMGERWIVKPEWADNE